MTGKMDAQAQAALQAAEPRQAIAKKIATLAPEVEDEHGAQIVLHLAEAYAHLAAEPPSVRPA